MDWTQTTMTVVEYHAAYQRGEVEINATYQRSDRVWPDAAKSFLIESLILGFPVPKLSLHQVTDIAKRRSRKEVVDGQQRSKAIWAFLEGKFPISAKSELTDAAGRTYDDLPEDMQQAILDYPLPFDLYLATSEADVREAFRRINSFTAPLNAEEQRHAQFQGPFKWFVYRLIKDRSTELINSGMFSEKQVVRMGDAKWVAEICHALLNGITTTSKATLDRMYRENERDFPQENKFRSRFDATLDRLWQWSELHKTSIMKPHMAYSLALAIMHTSEPVAELQASYRLDRRVDINDSQAIENLSELVEAFDAPEIADDSPMKAFVSASRTGTNVKGAREVRFQWFCDAIRGTLH